MHCAISSVLCLITHHMAPKAGRRKWKFGPASQQSGIWCSCIEKRRRKGKMKGKGGEGRHSRMRRTDGQWRRSGNVWRTVVNSDGQLDFRACSRTYWEMRLDGRFCVRTVYGIAYGLEFHINREDFVEWRQSKLLVSVSVVSFFFCTDFKFSHIAYSELIWSSKNSHIILGYVHILYPL